MIISRFSKKKFMLLSLLTLMSLTAEATQFKVQALDTIRLVKRFDQQQKSIEGSFLELEIVRPEGNISATLYCHDSLNTQFLVLLPQSQFDDGKGSADEIRKKILESGQYYIMPDGPTCEKIAFTIVSNDKWGANQILFVNDSTRRFEKIELSYVSSQ